jgi:hypothetical protein
MSADLENLTASFGLVRREFRDVHAVASRRSRRPLAAAPPQWWATSKT